VVRTQLVSTVTTNSRQCQSPSGNFSVAGRGAAELADQQAQGWYPVSVVTGDQCGRLRKLVLVSIGAPLPGADHTQVQQLETVTEQTGDLLGVRMATGVGVFSYNWRAVSCRRRPSSVTSGPTWEITRMPPRHRSGRREC
jgi:hypothetical protein